MGLFGTVFGPILDVLGVRKTVSALGGLVGGSLTSIILGGVAARRDVIEAVEDATTPESVPQSILDAISQLGDTLTIIIGVVAVLALIVLLRR